MRQTVVPAQITTVEDKIAGNISFKQLLLLVTPVFMGGVMYVVLPPFMGYASYKIAAWVILATVCVVLAIRLKGILVIEWIILKSTFNLRPSHYIYNKNTQSMRHIASEIFQHEEEVPLVRKAEAIDEPTFRSLHRLEQIIGEPRANMIFSATKKGGLRVSIKEVK